MFFACPLRKLSNLFTKDDSYDLGLCGSSSPADIKVVTRLSLDTVHGSEPAYIRSSRCDFPDVSGIVRPTFRANLTWLAAGLDFQAGPGLLFTSTIQSPPPIRTNVAPPGLWPWQRRAGNNRWKQAAILQSASGDPCSDDRMQSLRINCSFGRLIPNVGFITCCAMECK